MIEKSRKNLKAKKADHYIIDEEDEEEYAGHESDEYQEDMDGLVASDEDSMGIPKKKRGGKGAKG